MQSKNTSLKDRIGINLLEGVLLNDLGWIYRDQPIVDIGLDGIIEIANESSVQGLLLAGVQVKTGKGNFHETAHSFRYYASKRHYEYWSKSAMPILLIAVFPDEDKVLYEFASQENFVKKDKTYALDIKKTKTLNTRRRNQLIEDITSHYDSFQDRLDELEDTDNLSGIEYIYLINEKFSEIKESILAIAKVMKEYRKTMKRTENDIHLLSKENVSHDSPRGKRLIKKMGIEMDRYRRRFGLESRDSSALFKEGIRIFLNYTDTYLDYHGRTESNYLFVKPHLEDLRKAAIEGREIPAEMYQVFESSTHLIKLLSPQLRKARNALLKEYRRSIKNYEEFRELIEDYINKIPPPL